MLRRRTSVARIRTSRQHAAPSRPAPPRRGGGTWPWTSSRCRRSLDGMQASFFGCPPRPHRRLEPMQVHLDVLGWLHVLVGGMGLLTGTAFRVLAGGTGWMALAIRTRVVSDRVFAAAGPAALLSLGGWLMAAIGRALGARRPGGRARRSVAAAEPVRPAVRHRPQHLHLWALLNDDARRAFGRPTRAAATYNQDHDLTFRSSSARTHFAPSTTPTSTRTSSRSDSSRTSGSTGSRVAFIVELTTPACPVKDLLRRQARAAVPRAAGRDGASTSR